MNHRHFIVDLDDTLANTHEDLNDDRARLQHLTLAPGALGFLQSAHPNLTLLSAGEDVWQHTKIDHLGIRPYLNDIVIVPKSYVKHEALPQIVERLGKNKTELVVVGDRLECEIAAANKLGITTVRMRLPGGKYTPIDPQDPLQQATYTVGSFHELTELLSRLDAK